MSEDAKIWVRNARADSHKDIKNAENNKEISEDESRDLEVDLQKLVDDANKKIDELYKHKSEDIMKV
jgi:ribosome recycling factor